MSDEFAAPPAPDPASPPPPMKPGGVRPGLPPRKVAAVPKPPGNLKKYLVLGIILSTVVLLGLIGWRLYVRLSQKPIVVRNVKVEWENAWNRARLAHREIFEKIEAPVWTQGKELAPEDLAKAKNCLTTFQSTAETYHELMEAIRGQKKENSQEMIDMASTQIVLKTWIWDANGLLDPASKPPKYGGLYIPMYTVEKRMQEAAGRLKELKGQAQEIVSRGNAEEIEKTVAEVRGLAETFAALRDEFRQLDDDLLAGLTLPDLKKEQLPELADLREYQSIAQMSFMMARDLRSAFPSPEEPEPEEPKEEEPKQEPPKEEPPKEEPPKEQEPK